jgi:hypothetical protein
MSLISAPSMPAGRGADPSDPHVATGEGSDAVDGITRASVARGLRLEQRQRPLRTVGGPHGQHSPVVLAQRQGARLAFHGEDSPSPTRARIVAVNPGRAWCR